MPVREKYFAGKAYSVVESSIEERKKLMRYVSKDYKPYVRDIALGEPEFNEDTGRYAQPVTVVWINDEKSRYSSSGEMRNLIKDNGNDEIDDLLRDVYACSGKGKYPLSQTELQRYRKQTAEKLNGFGVDPKKFGIFVSEKSLEEKLNRVNNRTKKT